MSNNRWKDKHKLDQINKSGKPIGNKGRLSVRVFSVQGKYYNPGKKLGGESIDYTD
jgi:hypothetical protein